MVKRKATSIGLEGERPKTLQGWLGVVPWSPLVAVLMFLPGIIIWAYYAIKCKEHTIVFFNTVAPVSSSIIDAVSGAVQTTLITLAAVGTFVFGLALLLAIARAVQHHKLVPDCCCPCARPSPSSYTMYMAFNVGFNTIVFLVMMAIILLIAGAFLWLVVAYAANSSIRYGVREAERSGSTTQQLGSSALVNLTTMVDYYQIQMKAAPVCVKNSTWLTAINGTLSNMLYPRNDTNGGGNTVLCPYSCLNLGSFATLFRLGQNCICDQQRLNALLTESMTISTHAGVAMGGLVIILLACLILNMNLTAQFTAARYEYFLAMEQQDTWHSFSPGDDGEDGTEDDPERGRSSSYKGWGYDGDDVGGDTVSSSRDTGRLPGTYSRGSHRSSSGRKHHKRSSSSAAKAAALGLDGSMRSSKGAASAAAAAAAAAAVGGGVSSGGYDSGVGTPAATSGGSAGGEVVDSARDVQEGRGNTLGPLGAGTSSWRKLQGGAADTPPLNGAASHINSSAFLDPTAAAAAAVSARHMYGSDAAIVMAGGQRATELTELQQHLRSRSSSGYSQEWGLEDLGRPLQQQQQQQQAGYQSAKTVPASMGRQWEQQQQQQQQQQQPRPWSAGQAHVGGGVGSSVDSGGSSRSSQQQQGLSWEALALQQQQQNQLPRKNRAMRELLLGQVPLTRSTSNRTSSGVLPSGGSGSSSTRGAPSGVELTQVQQSPAGVGQPGQPTGQTSHLEQLTGRSNRPLQVTSVHSHHTPTSSRDSRDSVIVYDDVAEHAGSPYAGAVASAGLPYSSLTHPSPASSSRLGLSIAPGSSSTSSSSRLGPSPAVAVATSSSGSSSSIPGATSWQTLPTGSRQGLHMIAESSPLSPRSSLLRSSLGTSPPTYSSSSQRLPTIPQETTTAAAAAAAAAPPEAADWQQQQPKRHQRFGAVDLSHLEGDWLAGPGLGQGAATKAAPFSDPWSAAPEAATGGPAGAAAAGAAGAGKASSHHHQQQERLAGVPPPSVMQSRAQAPPRPQPLTIPDQVVPSAATTATTATTTASSSAGSFRQGGLAPAFDQSPAVDRSNMQPALPDSQSQAGYTTPTDQQVGGSGVGYHHAHHWSTSSSQKSGGWASNPPSSSHGGKSVTFDGTDAASSALGSHPRAVTPGYDDGRSPADKLLRSPYDRQRSGFRSSLRKGLVVYDQYKHRTPGGGPPGYAYSSAVNAATPRATAPAAAAAPAAGSTTASGRYSGQGRPPPAAAASNGSEESSGLLPAEGATGSAAAAADPLAALSRRYKNRMPAI